MVVSGSRISTTKTLYATGPAAHKYAMAGDQPQRYTRGSNRLAIPGSDAYTKYEDNWVAITLSILWWSRRELN